MYIWRDLPPGISRVYLGYISAHFLATWRRHSSIEMDPDKNASTPDMTTASVIVPYARQSSARQPLANLQRCTVPSDRQWVRVWFECDLWHRAVTRCAVVVALKQGIEARAR